MDAEKLAKGLEALSKPFYGEPLSTDAAAITVVGESILHKVMCAPKTATRAEVERAAGDAGTSGGWQAATDRPDCCVQCQDDPNRQHWLLVC